MTNSEKQLSKLYELSLLLSGEPTDIIRKIAGMIAEFYDVRVVVLTEIKDKELYFLCAHVDGKLKTDLGHIPLEFTPCALVKEGKQGQFFDQVSEIFPQVDFLKQQKAFFYYGVPAMDSKGNVISTTCLLDEKHHELSDQSQELLRIFGQRIAMELERKSSLTKQAKTEEALQNSQSQLYGLTNISPVGIFRTDIDGQYIYVNEQWCHFSGMTVEQAAGRGWMEAVHPQDRQLVRSAWDKFLGNSDSFELEYRYLSPQRKTTWVVGRVTAEKNITDDITGYIGVVTDITDRKKQEEDNNSIHLKLMEAQTIAHLGFFECNIDTDVTYWSDETYRILGTDPQHTRPGFDSFVSFIHPDDLSLVKDARKQLDHGGLYNIDYRIIKPDGNESILHGEAKLYVDTENQQRKIIGTVQDISERKYVEHALNALAEHSAIDDMTSFYKNMVHNFARVYNARFAFLGLFPEGRTDIIQLQAFWTGDDFGENVDYTIHNTPSADVLNHQIKMIPENVASQYPDDHFLTEWEIESYYGETLITPSGKKIGIIAVMDTEPMIIGHWTKSILGLFAQQVASRIEHNSDEREMKKMSSALEQTADMVLIANKKGIIEYVNPMFEKITGYHSEQLIGNKPNVLSSGQHDSAFYKKLWDTILSGNVFTDVLINRKQDGSLFYQDQIITPLKNKDGEITHFIATGRDISQRMENEKRLKFIAHHDALTSLPNRILFMDRIKRSLAHARRSGERIAVLFFDLDRFKNINDTLGHILGDKLLIEIANRLKKVIREDDSIARLGGDEFAVLINKISSEKDVTQVAQKILNCIEKSAIIEDHSLYTTASIGISLYPVDGGDADTLLKNADIAMYRAKDLGKNNYQFYSKEMSSRAIQRLAMENNLRMALDRNEFVLYYQPQVDTNSQNIVGVEALIRWQHPELGLIPPSDFISLLEETGLIIDVGNWVLETACQQLKDWSQSGFKDLSMSVNVSSRQFHRQTFYDRVVELAEKYALPSEKIELEITESILMDNQKSTTENINKLDDYGFRIAIDDFGTGYSSLSYLQHFKIDTLKIDRSFIKDIDTNTDDANITAAIIAMAHSLKLNIVAEGVETQQQLDFLKQHDCQQIQGYLFSRPLIAEEMTQLLHRGLPQKTET